MSIKTATIIRTESFGEHTNDNPAAGLMAELAPTGLPIIIAASPCLNIRSPPPAVVFGFCNPAATGITVSDHIPKRRPLLPAGAVN